MKAWLNAEDSDVNSRSVDGQTLLGTCVLAAAHSQSKFEARNHLEVARMLVGRHRRRVLQEVRPPAAPGIAQPALARAARQARDDRSRHEVARRRRQPRRVERAHVLGGVVIV